MNRLEAIKIIYTEAQHYGKIPKAMYARNCDALAALGLNFDEIAEALDWFGMPPSDYYPESEIHKAIKRAAKGSAK